MPDFRTGDEALFYINNGTYASPTWSMMKAVSDASFDLQASNIEVKHRGFATGHKHGEADPVFTFTLIEDDGADVETLVAAEDDGSMVQIALSSLPIATSGATYYDLEAVIMGAASAGQGDPATRAYTAKRHADSSNDIRRTTV